MVNTKTKIKPQSNRLTVLHTWERLSASFKHLIVNGKTLADIVHPNINLPLRGSGSHGTILLTQKHIRHPS
jgi:hypothetical protein